MKSRKYLRSVVGFLPLFCLCAATLHGATLWNGPEISFTKPNGGNPFLAANQDRLAPDIWITRGSSQGLFNASTEGGFAHFSSPAGTEWATGSLLNYATLSYHDWNTWAKGVNAGPTSTIGINAVVHLIPENIYLSVRFTSWTSGGAGGGFSYFRSTPAVPEPASGAILLTGGLLMAAKLRRRSAKA